MSYTLNSIDISTYSLIPVQGSDTNIALAGCFDLPARIGQTEYDWQDSDSIEPYVASEDMGFAGRDIVFTAMIKDTKTGAATKLNTFYTAINAWTGTKPFSTPYGVFYNVYVKSVNVVQYISVSLVTITLHEPKPVLTYGFMPSTASSTNMIDGIPFTSFGLYVSNQTDKVSLPELKKMDYTAYLVEKFKKVKRSALDFKIEGFIVGNDVSNFLDNVFALQNIFASPGLRSIVLNGNSAISCYAKSGFQITSVQKLDKIYAKFSISLTIAN
jgi:hypothetical protein